MEHHRANEDKTYRGNYQENGGIVRTKSRLGLVFYDLVTRKIAAANYALTF